MKNVKRIAFIRLKAWPLANSIVEGVLKKQFPDHPVDVFDISLIVKKRPHIVLINSMITLLMYGTDLLRRRKKFRIAFWRTPYIFKQIRKLMQEQISKDEYVFSFQMQSLFDASVPGLPHFLYTDHTHLENLHYTTNKHNLFSTRWIELERSIYRNTTLNFVRSSNVQRSMIEDYGCPAEKVKLVYAGSNASVSSIKTQNTDYADPHILFVGLDWKRKGGADLVEAFKLVQKDHPNARLTIVGAKPDLDLLNCEVIGQVKPEDLDQYYQRASVFCLPTHLEPFGIVFIEAMTAHLPIVATRVGAIPDFVEEGRNGWLVAPGNVKGVAGVLLKLLKDPALARDFGEHSYQIAEERYSWDAVGLLFKQHINHALDSSRRNST